VKQIAWLRRDKHVAMVDGAVVPVLILIGFLASTRRRAEAQHSSAAQSLEEAGRQRAAGRGSAADRDASPPRHRHARSQLAEHAVRSERRGAYWSATAVGGGGCSAGEQIGDPSQPAA
jgi:hypothetical protein